MANEHANLEGENLHKPGYVQNSDPGAIGAGKLWVDTTAGTGKWIIKVRNAANTGWETMAFASGAVRITGDGRLLLQWQAADGGDDLFYEVKFYTVDGERAFGQSNTGEA